MLILRGERMSKQDREAAARARELGISYPAALRQVRERRNRERVEVDVVMRTVGGARFPEHLAEQMVRWCTPELGSYTMRALSFRLPDSESRPPFTAMVRRAVLSDDGTELRLVLAFNLPAVQHLPEQRPVELRLAATSLAELVQAHQAAAGSRTRGG
jgi:hypothetical protein